MQGLISSLDNRRQITHIRPLASSCQARYFAVTEFITLDCKFATAKFIVTPWLSK